MIAALSGRALAQAARRAGYAPLVADLFGDLDTREAAAETLVLRGDLRRGLPGRALMAGLERLAAGRAPVGLVYGSGFEDRPRLLARLAARHGLLGNAPATLRAVKRPPALAALCARAGIVHPPPCRAAGGSGAWVEKRAGGSGGVHVRPVPAGTSARPGRYVQAWLPGRLVSAVFVADGRDARVLGFCEQWVDAAPGRPFRYGGAVRPATLPAAAVAAMAGAVSRLAAAAGLVGLNGADFLVDGEACVLLEVNPRPGATLDLFVDAAGSVFGLHVLGCRGVLGEELPACAPAAAAAVVYARRGVVLPTSFRWPDWAADRQPSGAPVAAGAPLCSVLAEAPAARALVAQRAAAILAMAEGT